MQTQTEKGNIFEEAPAHARRKKVATGIASVNGINIHYKIQGEGDPLIMISGFGSTQSDWRFQTSAFKVRYRVITFDNRGVGKSDKPAGPYSTKMMAADTIGLMDHLGIQKAHVLGASMGGMIAQELAINYPERVNKLVLACTFAVRDKASESTPKSSQGKELYTKSRPSEPRIRKYFDALSGLAFNRRSYRIFITLMMKVMSRLTSPSATVGFSGQLDAVLTHNTIDRLKLIQAPTLVITGTQDRLINPTSSDVITNPIPKARLVKLEGGSHAFFIEMRSQFNKEVLNFLENY